MSDVDPPLPVRRRRAVGPPGAPTPGEEPRLDVGAEQGPDVEPDDDERLRREVPPHHGD